MAAGTRTIEDILAAIKTVLEPVTFGAGSETLGTILTDIRLTDSDTKALALLESQNDGQVAKGVLVYPPTDPQPSEGGGITEIEYLYNFEVQFIYPFDSKADGNGQTSWTRAILAQIAMKQAFESARALGLKDDSNTIPDNTVRNMLLRDGQRLMVGDYGNSGSDRKKIHYASFTLPVQVSVYTPMND